MTNFTLILTCEHAVNTIPPAYLYLFERNADVLHTHRGIDLGALSVASYLSEKLSCTLIRASVSRLLIDCNRSLTHPHCFSEFSKRLEKMEKQLLIAQYYSRFREKTTQTIEKIIQQGTRVLHLSIHSFTPELNGVTRNVDIGLLYDPARHPEKNFARQWKTLLQQHQPSYRIRMNYPYRGNSDGFTTALRSRYSTEVYLGLEIELNQNFSYENSALQKVMEAMSQSLPLLLHSR